ncbi:MAG: BREX-2 system adenine-specific DNA-methyltransferase PglX [Rubrivivax sp.]|nr:BREX-2 system adenine-specific DNA-methyltransferase PglX [Rubrivivax sp.]
MRVYRARLRKPLFLVYAFVATHNHFALYRGPSVFEQSAPVIQLPEGTDESDYVGLAGILNSSVACCWMKQVFHNKGSTVDQHGARQRTDAFEDFFEFTSTGLRDFPVPANRPSSIPESLNSLADDLAASSPSALTALSKSGESFPTQAAFSTGRRVCESIRQKMIALQEELDWQCYRLYQLLPPEATTADFECASPPELKLGERAFEIELARRVAAGDDTTTWFERHGSTAITELPAHWPADYRAVVERRIALIESDRNIGLIERPEFKRRWNTPAWDDLEKAALRDWLLDRLEQPAFWPASADSPPQLTTTNRLADLARADAAFTQVAALYAGHADFDPARLVAELVAAEAVPLLPVQRNTDDGLRKRAQWESTWALQRREDAIDAQVVADNSDEWRGEFTAMARTTFGSDTTDEARAWIAQKLAAEIKRHQDERKSAEVGPIPVPPKYKSTDFLRADFWRLRGGLDLPKERFVSFPGAERGADGSLALAWAGWNHLQLATALAGYYVDMKDTEGWEPARLQPLLTGLLELVPWLEQWHNEIDPAYGERMGTYYGGFVSEEARALGFTLDDLRAWKPTVTAAKRGRKKATREA